MTLAVLQASVLQTNGALSVAAGAQITVRTPAGALATLYEDRVGTTPAGNPVTADSKGFFRVYVAPGRYDVTVTTSSGTQVYKDIALFAEGDVVAAMVDNIADLRALPSYSSQDGMSVQLRGYYTPGDGGGGPLRIWKGGAAPGTYVDNGGSIIVPTGGDGSGAWVSGIYADSKLIKIPSDFPTLQAAIDALHGGVDLRRGGTVELRIESGHVITSTLRLQRGDYRYFTITSEDAVVLCNMTGTDGLFEGWSHCDFPVVASLFDMQGTGGNGLYLANNSRGWIPPSSTKTHGVKNAGDRNVLCYRGSWLSIGSKLDSTDIKFDFSGAGTDGIMCLRGSWVFATNCIITNAGRFGIHARHGSHVVANQSIVTGAAERCLNVSSGGYISCSNGAVIDAGSYNVAPNQLTGDAGFILSDSAGTSRGLGIISKTGDATEGVITYSDGSVKAWKVVLVDSTVGVLQSFDMPVPVPAKAKLYVCGADYDNTSPVGGSGAAARGAAAASTVWGRGPDSKVGFYVTAPSTANTNTLIGYMVVVDIPTYS